MKYLHRLVSLVVASAAFFIACNPAAAQWQVPSGEIPLGRGAGKTGFSSVTPNNIPYTAPGTGALTRTMGAKNAEVLSAKDFGAAGNASTDDTTALQNWINACQATGNTCFLNAGTYLISSALQVTNTIHITGVSRYQSTIALSSPTQDGIDVTTINQVYFDNFGFGGAASATAGNCISVQPTSLSNPQSRFQTLRFSGCFGSINFTRAAYWDVGGSHFFSCVAYCIKIQNQDNGDEGDSTIHDNLFIYPSSTNNIDQNAIFWSSSGGLRVINNKILNGFRGINISLAAGVNTGAIMITANSIENQFADAIFMQRAASTGTIGSIVINGNETLGFGNANGIRVVGTTAWVAGLGITGNVIKLSIDGTGATPRGIQLSAVDIATITGNTIGCGVTTGSIGVFNDNTVNAVAHSGNNIHGCTTAVSDSSTNPYSGY